MSEELNPAPANKRRDLIEKFNDEYAMALDAAIISESHTATEGWRRLYAGHEVRMQTERHKMAQGLRYLAARIDRSSLAGDEEKQLGEIKKSSQSLREQDDSFYISTVLPVRGPVDVCEKIIDEARNAARIQESEEPMMNIGLEELMKSAISNVRRAKFDAETGTVVIVAASGISEND